MSFNNEECKRIEIYSADGSTAIDSFKAPIGSAEELFGQLKASKKLDAHPPPPGHEWTTLEDAQGTKTLWKQQVDAGKYKIVATAPLAPPPPAGQ
jgi:hypothetical protein